jgi:hypothetical protein
MDLMYLLALLCYYGPTPLAAFLAGWQALQCSSPWQAFAVGLVGTIALAVVFGVASDYLPVWGAGFSVSRMWQMHLMVSPFVGVPLGAFCAVTVHRRNTPSNDAS